MKYSRISPGVFMSKDNKYLYAFCGEISYIEKYDVAHNFWEDVNFIKPDLFGTRYGIKCIPMWKCPDEKIRDKFENQVLVFGGEQTEVSSIDMSNPENLEVNYVEQKVNSLKKLYRRIKKKSEANILKLEGSGQFYEPYVFDQQNLVLLDRNEIHAIDLKKLTA